MGNKICKNILILSVIVLVSVLFFSAVEADAANKESELFDKAYGYSMSNQYEKAVEAFNLFLKEFPKSSSRDAAMYWLGKSLIQIKSFEDAKKVFSEVIKNYPESPFLPHIKTELQALNTQSGAGIIAANADAKNLADNVVKAINDLQFKITATEQMAAAAEAALAQSVAEREKLQAQLLEEKIKLDAREAQLKNLTDNSAKTVHELQLKLTVAEQMAAGSEAALAQSVAEREKLQAQLLEEKKKLDAGEVELRNLADNVSKAINELKLKLAAKEQKPEAVKTSPQTATVQKPEAVKATPPQPSAKKKSR